MNEKNKTAALLWRKMGVMIDAGLPLMKTLATIVKEIPDSDSLRHVISGVAAMIENGSTFKEALLKYPQTFPPTVLALIEVGEMTGSLEKVMIKIAENYENDTFTAGETPRHESETGDGPRSTITADDEASIKFVGKVLSESLKSGAGVIHFEWVNGSMRIRHRIDGVLHDLAAPPRPIQEAVIRRLKIMGGMNVAEKRLPQDGRIQLNISGTPLDCRVSTAPYVTGESVVVRMLNKQSALPGPDQIGFSPENSAKLKGWLRRTNGMIITAGPAGSGKTTLLYTCVKELNNDGMKIVTVEDPVEYVIAGVNQLQVKQELGLTFAAALRGTIRQDPDVFMIGEIRDRETAATGVQAALTGHLVLASLYTNDTSEAVRRLMDLGIEPFLVGSTLIGVCAQRLVRKICGECREEYEPEAWRLELSKAAPGMKFYRGKGCPACCQTGYHGRIAIHEMLEMNDRMRSVLAQDPDIEKIRKAARDSGVLTLREDGLAKVKQGITTIEEVLKWTDGQ